MACRWVDRDYRDLFELDSQTDKFVSAKDASGNPG